MLWFFQIVTDHETGRARGFGFVNFEDNKSMNDAIQGMNGQELGGRNITVNKANDRPRRWRAWTTAARRLATPPFNL